MDEKPTGFSGESEAAGNDNGNTEVEKTYWESENEPQVKGRLDQEAGLESAEEFYLRYQAYINQGSEALPPQPEPGSNKPSGRKVFKKVIAIIIAIVLLSGAGIAVYAFQDEIMNSIALMTKSPREYYGYVEVNNIMKLTRDITSGMSRFESRDADYKFAMDLSYDKDTVNSLISPLTGASISDVEAMIGFPLNSIGLDMIIARDDSKLYDELNLMLNKTGIFKAQFFLDTARNEMLMGFPDLTSDYLKISNDEIASKKQANTITAERTQDFIKRYSSVITDQITDVQVELNKNTELTVGKTTVNAALLTVTIDYDTYANIMDAVLIEAYDDEYFLDLVSQLGKTRDEYHKALEDIRDDLSSRADADNKNAKVIMKVYVNNKGDIIGREIESVIQDKTDSKLGMFRINKENKGCYEFYIIDNNGSKLVSVEGSHTKSNNAYSGGADISFDGKEAGKISIYVEYEDVKREKQRNMTYLYGTISLTTPRLPGTEIQLKLDAEDKVQKADLLFNMGSTSLITLSTTTERLEDFKLPLPDSSARVYESEEAESFSDSFDVDGYIDNLSDKLGVDLRLIAELFMSSY